MDNLRLSLEELSREGPEKLTVVFGGHGGFDGSAMWGRGTLIAEEWLELQKKFLPSTSIKSVFLQCYAGSVVVPRDRKRPERVASLERFLLAHYPKNRCALAMSSDDELGQYYGYDSPNWESSPWSLLLKRRPELSLDGLGAALFDDDTLKITPMTTRDYFLGDLQSTVCAEAKTLSGLQSRHGRLPSHWPPAARKKAAGSLLLKMDADAMPSIERVCAQLENDPVHLASRQMLVHKERYQDEPGKLLVQSIVDLIKAEFPEFQGKSGMPPAEMEKIYETYIRLGKDTGFTSAQLYDLMRLLATPNLDWSRTLMAFSHSKKCKAILNRRFRDFMSLPGKRDFYEQFLQEKWMDEDYSGLAIAEFHDALNAHGFSLGKDRKGRHLEYRQRQRRELESLLGQLRSLESVRPLYRSIQSCQAAPLRNDH
ncbi:MAG: hypothetical protein AAB036_02690 [Elusimicrobiota bacterium]